MSVIQGVVAPDVRGLGRSFAGTLQAAQPPALPREHQVRQDVAEPGAEGSERFAQFMEAAMFVFIAACGFLLAAAVLRMAA